MRFDIATIFPDIFNSYFNESILKLAQKKKLIEINIHNLRDYTNDKHKKVDDKAFGGGPGMVVKADVVYRALKSIKCQVPNVTKPMSNVKCQMSKKKKIILLSAKGEMFNSKMAREWSKLDQLVMICGRYEGVDERVAKYLIDEEISIGDFVLLGGELPAMIIVEAVARLIPGVLGNKESLHDSGYPVYTRPEKFKNWKIPKVLLSGDHKRIEEWRRKHSKM